MVLVSSKDNTNVKNAVKLKKSAKFRRETSCFIAEGVRICMDAMLSKADISVFFATESAAEKYENDFKSLSSYSKKTIIVTESVFDIMSDTKTPQGFLCIIKALDKMSQFDTIKYNGKFLALDNVQDPNNLGTILRSAEAFNISGVILSADCCDIFSPKVVRGSMGAVFRLPFIKCESIAKFLEEHSDIESFATVVTDDAENITEVDFNSPCVTVIGNEGNGLKEETVKACKTRITIPMNGKAESLNASVAASIVMWEMVK